MVKTEIIDKDVEYWILKLMLLTWQQTYYYFVISKTVIFFKDIYLFYVYLFCRS